MLCFDLIEKGAGNCFPQSLRANPIRGTAQHGGLTEIVLPEQEGDRNVFVWLTWHKQRKRTPPKQLDFLIPLPESRLGQMSHSVSCMGQ